LVKAVSGFRISPNKQQKAHALRFELVARR
jgi:hypothetical protein